MSSQLPFTPLTPDDLARLEPAERMAFTVAAGQVARDENPGINTTAALLLTIQRLIADALERAESAREAPASVEPPRAAATADVSVRPRTGASLPEGLAEVAAERSRALNAERRLADITANLRLLAEGCRELASNGRDLDRNCTASAAYQDVASDILAIIGTEGETT